MDATDDRESLKRRVAELEAENDALRREGEDLDHQVAQLETAVDELSRQNEEMGLELQESNHLDEQVEQLEHDLNQTVQENEELSREVEALTVAQPEGASGTDEERVYLASNSRKHFHRPKCEWAAYIPDYKLIEFSSHAEAVAAGYKPCKTCRA